MTSSGSLCCHQVKSEALWILGRYRQDRLDQTFDTDTVRRQGSLELADV